MRFTKIKNVKIDYVLVAILILALILRFYNLDFQSVWLDEIHTMIETSPSLSFSEFLDLMFTREQMPLLYFLIVKFFTSIFGPSVFVVRMISSVIGVLSVYSIYFLGRELVSKKTGYFAAGFLAINQVHIFYSQEARPYILLSLFTILSFLFLVKFIKKLNLKSGVYYALFAALMINTHFFGLFVLASQAIILLIQLVSLDKVQKRKFFFNALISGIIIALLFIPSIPVFIKASKLSSFWIQPPSLSFFKELFNSFFGGSEFLIYLANLFVLAFFIKLFSQKKANSLTNNKYVLSFTILMVWLFTIFMIPYIRTYTNVPILLNRYFMSALPAIIIVLAIGLASIRVKSIIVILTIFFVFSSFVDIILVKNYYNSVNKTQYREITKEVISKNIKESPIVSPWAWHLEYFIHSKDKLVSNTLNEYVDRLRTNNQIKASFWFLDAHFHDYSVSPENELYLKENFYLVDEIEYFDTWAKYYVVRNKSETISVNLNDFAPNFVQNNKHILLTFSSVIQAKDIMLTTGEYRLALKTKSYPDPPINNENSHIAVSLNGKRLGGFYTSSKAIETTIFDFKIDNDLQSTIALTFGNGYFDENVDRSLMIYMVSIEKIN